MSTQHEDVIRPVLSRAETELIMRGLDALTDAAATMDAMDPPRDLKARLQTAAMKKGWRIE